ncbi:putative disease resistance RPP13-like protein 1, partial [Dichanthelium oligosanthes]
MAEVAAVGWAISVLGWVASPVTTRLISDDFDETEKLRDLEARLLPQLALMREHAERIPPGQRTHVELWAKKLRAAFYDAEDILDVADYYRLQNQVNCQSGAKSALDCAKHVISGKARKLKKDLKKLEKLIEQGSQFLTLLAISTSSIGSHGNDTSNPANNVNGLATTSRALTHIIVGRDGEQDEIIRLLHDTAGDFEPSSSNSKCYSVIGIYGIAGSGKTTLAQHVCNYEQNGNYFCPIMWIHVPQNFIVDEIYQKMLEAASVESPLAFKNLDNLQMKLEDELRGKRFLLVLDDIEDVKDVSVQSKLDQLLSPLRVGKKGSMVLVTTRFKGAAAYLGDQNPMKIPDLNEADFFNLFMHYALGTATLDAKELETLQMIGKKIMKKLKGSPLAARVVGARLCENLNATTWRRLEDQDVLPANTMGALWWSYQHLNERVRRCFAYCSMFPQGYMFKRDELVDLWIAEGFITTTNNPDEQMEAVAQNYFDELVSCSFLQTRKTFYGSASECFTIHDLLHELAVMVAGNDCFRVEGGEMKEFPPDVRHLYVCSKDQVKVTEQICKLGKLRTLIFITNIGGQGITIEELEDMLKKLKKLRVVQVDIEGYMAKIPTCICELKHLRFLRIHNPMSMKVLLPKNLGTIYHLQILELRGSGFSRLGELKSLRELSHFKVKKEKGYELQQLKGINHLRGRLRISGLDCVEKSSLGQQNFSPDLQVEILEGLCPPSQLTELRIWSYGGWKCPSWLSQNQDSLLSSLQYLELCRCDNLDALPEIGELFIHLGHLKLVSLPKLEKLPRLPDSVKILDIQRCKALVVTCLEDVDMTRRLFIQQASQIERSLNTVVQPEEIDRFADEHPERFATILCDIFGRCGTLLPRLLRGQIREEDYTQFVLPASVDRIIISYCAITDTVLHKSLRASTSLFSLNLRGLLFFTEIPSDVMQSLPMLSDLSIDECLQFKHLQGLNHLSRLQHLRITKCPNLETLGEADKVRILHGIATDSISLVPQLLSGEGCSSLWILRIDESEEL